jgi:hypothetical protein
LQKCRVPRKSGISICLYNGLVNCGGANPWGLAFAAHLACGALLGGTVMRTYSLTLLAAAAVALAAGQVASAADLGRPLPPAPAYVPPPAPVFSWTGFYIGGNLGAAWTQGDVSDSFGNSFSNSQKAVFAGGGQVGANYQFNWLVVGVEADFDWLANNSNSSNAVFVPVSEISNFLPTTDG